MEPMTRRGADVPERARSQVNVPNGKWENLLKLLIDGRKSGASDLHVIAGRSAYWRIDGDLLDDCSAPDEEEVLRFMHDVCTEYQYLRLSTNWSTDSSCTNADFGRIRIHAAQTSTGIALVLRYLNDEPPDFADLDLPDTIAAWARRPSGLIVFSGVTGSGKTTLQASLTRYMLEHRNVRIWTFEDPIEYLFDTTDRVSQRELGRHFVDFELGLEDAMREDPDVLIMGEIRSPATARGALKAAESGHLVMATIHSSEPSRVAARFLGMFAADERELIRIQLSSTLIGITGMKLVKYSPDYRKRYPEARGRRAAVEVCVKTDAVAGAIISGSQKTIRDSITTGSASGMKPLERHLMQLVNDRQITMDEANEAAEHPDELDWNKRRN